jgi:hypothetical protein
LIGKHKEEGGCEEDDRPCNEPNLKRRKGKLLEVKFALFDEYYFITVFKHKFLLELARKI